MKKNTLDRGRVMETLFSIGLLMLALGAILILLAIVFGVDIEGVSDDEKSAVTARGGDSVVTTARG